MDNLLEVLAPQGLFIASGIIEENKDMVITKMIEKRLDILDIKIQEQWAVIVACKDS